MTEELSVRISLVVDQYLGRMRRVFETLDQLRDKAKRAGRQLTISLTAPIVGFATVALRQLAKVDSKAAQTLAALGDQFDRLNETVGKAFLPVVRALTKALSVMNDILDKIPDSVLTVIAVLASLLAAIGPLLVAFAALVPVIKTFIVVVGAAGVALAGLVAAMGPLGLALVALGAAFLAVSVKGEKTNKKFEGTRVKALQAAAAAEKLKIEISALSAVFENQNKLLALRLKLFGAFGQGGALQSAGSGFAELFGQGVAGASNLIPDLFARLRESRDRRVVNDATQNIDKFLGGLAVNSGINGLAARLGGALGGLSNAAGGGLAGLENVARNVFDQSSVGPAGTLEFNRVGSAESFAREARIAKDKQRSKAQVDTVSLLKKILEAMLKRPSIGVAGI